jgi:hypothetical protein
VNVTLVPSAETSADIEVDGLVGVVGRRRKAGQHQAVTHHDVGEDAGHQAAQYQV